MKNNFFNQVINRVFADGEPTAKATVHCASSIGSLPTVDRRSNYTSSTRHRVACILFVMLFSITQMWGADMPYFSEISANSSTKTPISNISAASSAGGKASVMVTKCTTDNSYVTFTLNSDVKSVFNNGDNSIYLCFSVDKDIQMSLCRSSNGNLKVVAYKNGSTLTKIASPAVMTSSSNFYSFKAGYTYYISTTSTSGNSFGTVRAYFKKMDDGTNVTVSGWWVESLPTSGPVDPTITFDDANYEIGSTLNLSTLFSSDNTTGAVTYAVKDAGTTGASITGSNFTATAVGTATVTASQAAVDGQFNAKAVDATITVKVAAVKYAVTFAPGEGASGEMDALQQAEGDVVTLPACTFNKPEGKVFKEWTSTNVTITDGKFTMPGNAVTITATWENAPTLIKLIDNGKLNTTDFRTVVTSLTSENYTVDGTAFTKCFALGNTNSAMVGVYDASKYIAYDSKTDAAEVKIYLYNKNSSAKNFTYIVIPEGYTTTPTQVQKSISSKGTGTVLTIQLTGRASLYCSVASGDVRFCQMTVEEKGTSLIAPRMPGYSISFVNPRFALKDNSAKTGTFEGFEINSNTAEKLLSGTDITLYTAGTQYIKFTLPVAAKVKFTGTFDTGAAISFNKTKAYNADENSFTAQGSVELEAGDWYINTNGKKSHFTKLEFLAATPKHHVTYAKGEATCEIALPTQDDVKEGASFKVADAIACNGLDFTGWNDGATTYDAGADYTMGTTDVTLTAQWKEHVTSTDATLKSLKVNDEEILDGDEVEYTIFAQTLPTVVATKNDPYATVAPTEATTIPGDFVYVVTAESGAQKTYTLHVKSYDEATGVLMKGELTSNKAATVSGIFPGNADVSVSNTKDGDGYKIGSDNQYIGLVPSEGSFKAGDIVIIDITTASTKLELFSDKGNNMIGSSDKVVANSENRVELTADANQIYLYRTSTAGSTMNPYVKSITVIRPIKHTVTYVKGATPEIIAKVSGDVPAPTQIAEEKVFQTAAADGLTHEDNLIFAGWNDGATTYAAGADYTMGTADVTFTAQWVSGFVVTYMDGTTQLGTEVVVDGNHPSASNINTNKPLFTFSHWENESGETVELNTIDDDITLYGKWNIAFAQTIDFEANAGASSLDETFWTSKNYAMSSTTGVSWDNNSKYADKGLKIKNSGTKLEFYVPANKLMIFKVGSTNGAKFDGTALTQKTSGSDVNFSNVIYDFAATDKKHTYQTTTGDWNILKSVIITDPFVITYNVPEGADCDKTEDTFIGQSLTAPDATMEGKIFLGWFDAETGGNLIATAGATLFPTKAMDLYAHFRDINVEAVTNFAVTPTDDPFSVSLSWNVPGMVDLSAANRYAAIKPSANDDYDDAPIIEDAEDGAVVVTTTIDSYGNGGVAFGVPAGLQIESYSFDCKREGTNYVLYGGLEIDNKLYWYNDGSNVGQLEPAAGQFVSYGPLSPNYIYWDGNNDKSSPYTGVKSISIYANVSDADVTDRECKFYVRNVRYHVADVADNDNQSVIVVRTKDAASTGIDDGEKIYEGTNFSLQDNLTEAGTYYYTVYAVGPQNTYVASEPIKYEFAKIRDGLTNGKLVTMCQAQPIAKMWGGAAFDVEKKYSVGIVCLEANIEEQPLTAGKPYIVQAEAPEIYVLYAEGDAATIVAEANGLVGNLSTASGNLDVEGDNSYIFLDNHLYKASKDNGNYVAPDRAYLNYDNVEDHSEQAAAPTRRRLSMGGVERGAATGWDELMMNNGATKFIRNNQLFIIRDGKLFNAQGAKMR